MKRHKLRNSIVIILGVGLVGVALVLTGVFRSSTVSEAIEQPLTDQQMKDLIPRGKELALAGDCFGCHSLPNGEMGAGGVAMELPVGTIYSTNITPDKTYGIGNYTRADFHRAVKEGVAKDVGNLYPAMPYVFTSITTSDDLDALYAYIMSIPPLAIPNQKNTGVFEFPVRPFMNFWTMVNFPNRTTPNNPERTDAWNRGAYLLEGLAHCGACHTPRNFMMGVEFDHSLSGGFADGLAIPDITAETLAKRGFTLSSLNEYLSTGVSTEGATFSEMETVTHFSTSQMSAADVTAMSTYLLTDKAGHLLSSSNTENKVIDEVAVDGRLNEGRLTYIASCSGCHGINGEGIPNVVPPLKGNGIMAMENPQTLIYLVLNGLNTANYTNGQRMYAMPGFKETLDDQSIADLLTWSRAQWGNQVKPITQLEIRKNR